MNRLLALSALVLFITMSWSCKQQNKSVIQEWQSKQILIPENIQFKSLGKDTIPVGVLDAPYKVLVYIDSAGCSSCKLSLPQWKQFIDSIGTSSLSFLFVVQSNNYREFEMQLKLANFQYPIIYDPKGAFNQLNQFPAEEQYRTLLLDQGNKVLLVGSPIHNPRIKKLYVQTIH